MPQKAEVGYAEIDLENVSTGGGVRKFCVNQAWDRCIVVETRAVSTKAIQPSTSKKTMEMKIMTAQAHVV